MNFQKFAVMAGAAAAGIIVAGFLLNMFRDNDLVKQAINGFDA